MSQAGLISVAASGGAVTSITGTANQVLVNGTSGVATTGPVTLTTPQDIGTSSDVQFGSVAVDDGTQLAPSYTFKTDVTTGFYSPAASQTIYAVSNNTFIASFSTGQVFLNQITAHGSGIVYKYNASATDIVLTTSNYIVGITSTAAVRTVTLPDIADPGTTFVIKDESGGAATNNINIVVNLGVKTIDGVTTYPINTNYGSATVYYNGTNYFVI